MSRALPNATKVGDRIWQIDDRDGFWKFRGNIGGFDQQPKSDKECYARYQGGVALFKKPKQQIFGIRSLPRVCRRIEKLQKVMRELDELKRTRGVLLEQLCERLESLLSEKFEVLDDYVTRIRYESHVFTINCPKTASGNGGGWGRPGGNRGGGITKNYELLHGYHHLITMDYRRNSVEDFVRVVEEVVPQMTLAAIRGVAPPNSNYRKEILDFLKSLG